jgi:myo-inositol catabolism protein IolS
MTLAKRPLGKSGIHVTELGLGLWAAGGGEWGPSDDAEISDAVDAALDLGVTFFDTADVYGNGHSEEVLGRSMQGRRDRFVVATKIGWRGFDGKERRTAYGSVRELIAGVESNLERLQTDYVDVIQSHISFRDPTMEVFLEGFQKLQRDGKVRAYGVSSSDLEYIQAFNQDGRCATLQIDYSILNRTPEADILGYCQKNGIGVIVRGALAMGILADKLDENASFPEGDFRRKWQSEPEQQAVFRQDLAKVRELRALVQEQRTLAQAALQFTLAHPAVSSVIPGARNVRQVQSNVGAARSPSLSPGDWAVIDGVTAPGAGRKIWPA